jgi:hypothetical protein
MAKFLKVYQHGVCVFQYKVPDTVWISQRRHNGIVSGEKEGDIICVYKSGTATTNKPMFTIYGTDRICIVDDYPQHYQVADYSSGDADYPLED